MYIAVEGKDFAGKTTLIAKLMEQLTNVKLVGEPNKLDVEMTQLREMIVNSKTMSNEVKTYLSIAQRIHLIDTEISPHLNENENNIVISDRCFLTNVAYQSGSFEESNDVLINNLNALDKRQYGIPDCIIYLDIDFDTYLARLETNKRGFLIDNTELGLSVKESFIDHGDRYEWALEQLGGYYPSMKIIKSNDIDEILRLIK